MSSLSSICVACIFFLHCVRKPVVLHWSVTVGYCVTSSSDICVYSLIIMIKNRPSRRSKKWFLLGKAVNYGCVGGVVVERKCWMLLAALAMTGVCVWVRVCARNELPFYTLDLKEGLRFSFTQLASHLLQGPQLEVQVQSPVNEWQLLFLQV